MYRHGRVMLIVAGCAAILGAMLLIPGGEQVAVADAPVASAPSQETIAAIDAMLGANQPLPEPPSGIRPGPASPVDGPDPNLQTAALGPPATTDLEGAPLVDPNLRPDSIGSTAVNLRAGPSTATATVTVLQPGQPVQTGESDGGWIEVTLPDGTTGWVYARYLASVATVAAAETPPAAAAPAAKPGKAVVSGKGSNGNLEGRTARIDAALVARSRPSSGASRVFRTEPGERVRILDVRGNWLHIVTSDGYSGWIERAG
jgi:SH3-like domain-containing protein